MIRRRRLSTGSLFSGVASACAFLFLVHGCGGLVVIEHDRGDDGQGGEGAASGASTGAGWEDIGCGDVLGTIASDPKSRAIVCFNRSGDEECPTIYQAIGHIAPSRPCSYIVSVDCGPNVVGQSCCYLVTEEAAACD